MDTEQAIRYVELGGIYLGDACTYKDAASEMMRRSIDAFAKGNDDMAFALRDLARYFTGKEYRAKQDQERHAGDDEEARLYLQSLVEPPPAPEAGEEGGG